MTAIVNDRVFDEGLSVLDTEVDKHVICSQAPTTYTEANATYMLGYKTSPTVSAPAVSLNSTMLVGTPSVADNIFSFVVQAGTSGEKYTARIKVDLSNNDKREIDFPFAVSEL
jgi:hypothetical protein